MNKRKLEKELLKQVPNTVRTARGLNSDDVLQFRLWATELQMQTLEIGRDQLATFPFGEDVFSPLALLHAKYLKLQAEPKEKLVCPSCGAVDQNNKKNGKPWCFKCDNILLPKEKVNKWKHSRSRVMSKAEFMREALKKINSVLYEGEQ